MSSFPTIHESERRTAQRKKLTAREKERVEQKADRYFRSLLDAGMLRHKDVGLESARYVCHLLACEDIVGPSIWDEREYTIVKEFFRELDDCGIWLRRIKAQLEGNSFPKNSASLLDRIEKIVYDVPIRSM